MSERNPIRKAVELLRGRWYQGEIASPDGEARCGLGWLMAAIVEVRAPRPLADSGRALMNSAAVDKFPDRAFPPVTSEELQMQPFAAFNDHPRTTESDVVLVMELAADRWDVEFG